MIEPLKPGDPDRLGAYELTGRLGEGGQGVVFEGRGPDDRRVAVKLLHARLSGDPAARARFVREIEAAERVAGFCTAQVLDADAEGDQPCIVSEFVPGPSLQRLVQEEGPRSGGDLHRLAIGTATALAAIHQAGVVHRDLKPPNVLIGPDGPRVIDFGIAKALDATGTMTSHIVGTPAYMAPEQVASDDLGPHTDVFAWGATILYAATGRAPFGSDTIPAVMHRILNAAPDVSALPAPLAGLVAACLSKDPAYRPTSTQLVLSLIGHQGAAPAVPGAVSGAVRVVGGDTVVEPLLEQGAGMATGKITPPPLPPVQFPFVPPHAASPQAASPQGFPPQAAPPPGPGAPLPGAHLPVAPAKGNPALTVAVVSFAMLGVHLGLYWSQNLLPSPGGVWFWAYVAYPAVLAGALVPLGRLADSIGRKRVFLSGLGGYAAALVLGMVFVDLMPAAGGGWPALLARALMGLSMAAVVAGGVALVREAFPGRGFGIAMGVWGAALSATTVVAALVFAVLRQMGGLPGWGVTAAAVPLVLLALGLGAGLLRESRREGPGRASDVPGALLLGLVGSCTVFGLWAVAEEGWGDWRAITGLACGAVFLLALVIVLLSVRPALIPPRLAATVVPALAAFTALWIYDRALFDAVYFGDSGSFGTAGLRLSPLLLGALVSAPLTGLLITRTGVRWPLAASPAALVLGAFLAFGLTLDADTPYGWVAVLLLLEGVAMGAITVAAAVAIAGSPPGGLTGFGGGLQAWCQAVGVQFTGAVLLVGAERDYDTGSGGARLDNLDDVYRTSLLVAMCLALLAAAGFAAVRRRDLAAGPDPDRAS
ncbi:bifunctional serine/threonine protein kinase/MFS transporter [Spirillospora sp. NPDC047279]|uniref:bifunctional serine/threonine protein kinase/MFS transporter n=1 Tax=Spirillospora sp. NPDC047279 TaxID=3155478 RepID=UPI0034028CCE